MLVGLAALMVLSTAAIAEESLPEDLSAGTALHLRIDAAIGPATADYILEGIKLAAIEGYPVVVLEIDTPGGLDSAMRDIIKGILASPVPVITYVSPAGSRAASAGTYILYASHIAAMTPASNLGAATPVQIGGSSPKPPELPGTDKAADKGSEAAEDKSAEPPADAMKAKMVNDAVAYIKGLAELRGRNAEWAERAVREAVSLTASEALEQNVIDIVATDMKDLLQQADGRLIKVNAEETTLATADMDTEYLEPDWRTKLLTIITDPSVAYMLMLAGIYGLLLEGYNPGAMVPGVVGAICLLLALFAFQVLPVNYAGLALMLLGVMLMIAEGFAPSFGVLGIGGLAAFVFGSVILMDTDVPGYSVSPILIGGVATLGGLASLGLVYMFVKARGRPIVSGAEGMIGQSAEVMGDFTGSGPFHGSVFIDGERWQAESATLVSKGKHVRVLAMHGLVLTVAAQDK